MSQDKQDSLHQSSAAAEKSFQRTKSFKEDVKNVSVKPLFNMSTRQEILYQMLLLF